MARNDTVLLDGIIEDRLESNLPSNDKGEVFEYLVLEQVLKEYDLSFEEIESGWVDGGHDGGIDGFYILINGHILQDVNDFAWPKKGIDLSIYIITCKHHETYKQVVLESLFSTVNEFLDLRLSNCELSGEYNLNVLKKRDDLIYAYKKSSPRLNSFEMNYIYASRGESSEVGQSIVSRSNQIVKITEESFGQCDVKFDFLGAREIVSLYRQHPNFSLELPYLDSLSRGERYILIVRLRDYYNFLKNEGDSTLRRYLFESNVRDFMGLNAVNEDIRITLSNKDSPDFWLLNNGVTILSTSAQLIGQSIYMEDIQIVNGLQTSESIFRHFSNSGDDENERAVMIKVIVSQDEAVRDQIIRATNNQTAVEQSSLHATERIQRDIEDILLRNGFYYDRRKNFYKNQGAQRDLILTPLYLASGVVSLLLKMPHHAGRMRAKVLRNAASYDAIFSEKIDLNVWPQVAAIIKKTDDYLYLIRGHSSGEGFLKKWRHLLSFCAVSAYLKKFNFSGKDLLKLDVEELVLEYIPKCWDSIVKFDADFVTVNSKKVKKSDLILILQVVSERFGIQNIGCVERYNNVYDSISGVSRPYRNTNVTPEFVKSVEDLLPPQPWKIGMNRAVIEKLGCSMAQYSVAIESLVNDGRIYRQKDGVLYDLEGNVVGSDKERVNSD